MGSRRTVEALQSADDEKKREKREGERKKRVAIYYSAAKLHQSKNARSAYINMSAT